MNRLVRDEHCRVQVPPSDVEHQPADAPRGQGVRGDAVGPGIDRLAGAQRVGECRRSLGLDADHPNVTGVVRRDAADQPAATHRDEQRVEVRRLLDQLEGQAALAEQGEWLVEGVHLHRVVAG